MRDLIIAVRTIATLAWLVLVYGFVGLPDDAFLWRMSPVGLLFFSVLLAMGVILYEAWRTPAPPRVSSMADQAPRIRRELWYLARHRNSCSRCR